MTVTLASGSIMQDDAQSSEFHMSPAGYTTDLHRIVLREIISKKIPEGWFPRNGIIVPPHLLENDGATKIFYNGFQEAQYLGDILIDRTIKLESPMTPRGLYEMLRDEGKYPIKEQRWGEQAVDFYLETTRWADNLAGYLILQFGKETKK